MGSRAAAQAWFSRHRQINAWVEPDAYAELKRRADHDGVTLSDILRDIVGDAITKTPASRYPWLAPATPKDHTT